MCTPESATNYRVQIFFKYFLINGPVRIFGKLVEVEKNGIKKLFRPAIKLFVVAKTIIYYYYIITVVGISKRLNRGRYQPF